MKRILALILSALMLSVFASCSSKTVSEDTTNDTETTGTATITGNTAETAFDYENSDLSTMVELGSYRKLDVVKASAELTEEEFDASIDQLIESYAYYAQITDRAVEEGDNVVCDYSGYLDGELFNGGSAADTTLTAASGTGYIDGFAEAFIGKNVGEEFSFNVTFPEDYGTETLNGKEVTFKATVKYIVGDYIVPELTDEFVNTNFGYDNVDEWKIAYHATVSEQKEYYVENQMYSELWANIVEASNVITYPETEVQRVYNETRAMYEAYASYYGTTYDIFLSNYIGMTDEELLEECRKTVKEDLVMYAVADELNIEVTDEDYAEQIAFFCDYYGATEDELLSYYGEEAISKTILWQKMLETIAPMNNIIEQ